MAVRDKAELRTQITDLIDSGGTPRISAANLRSVLDDLVDSLMLEPAHAASVTRYFGWSDDQVIATADLSSADESTSNVGEMPARSTNGYFYAAVPEDVGEPASLWLGDTALFATPSSRQAGTINDSNGDPHIVVVTVALIVSALAGQKAEVRY